MVTFTQQHMDAITDLANNVKFHGWHIIKTRTVGEKVGHQEKVAVVGAETKECTYTRKERIILYLDGSVAMRSRLVSPGGMEQFEPSALALSQLRVLLIAAERIAAASANLIKDAENEKHL